MTLMSFGQHEAEMAIEDCFESAYPELLKTRDSIYYRLESKLLEQKLIVDRTGDSYIELLQRIRDDKINTLEFNIFDYQVETQFDSLQQVKYFECLKKVQKSDIFKGSKIEQLYQSSHLFLVEDEQFENKVAASLLKTLDANDFELNFYKARLFLLLATLEFDTGMNRRLPPNDLEEIKISPDALRIHIKAKDEVTINEKKIETNKIANAIADYFNENLEEYQISLTNTRDTSYKKYIEIQAIVVKSIDNYKNKIANNHFSKNYNQLSYSEKKEVDEISKIKIIEGPPIDY